MKLGPLFLALLLALTDGVEGGWKTSAAPTPFNPSVCPQLRARPWPRPSILPSPESNSIQVGRHPGPAPRMAPPLTKPTCRVWPLGPSSLPSHASYFWLWPNPGSWLRPLPALLQRLVPPQEPTFSTAPHIFHRLCRSPAPSLALLPKACLGHALNSWPRPILPRCFGPTLRPVSRGAYAPPLSPDPGLAPPSHLAPSPNQSHPLCLSSAPPTLAPTDLTPTSTPGLCSHVSHSGHHAHRAQRPPAAAPPAAAAAARR